MAKRRARNLRHVVAYEEFRHFVLNYERSQTSRISKNFFADAEVSELLAYFLAVWR